MFSCQPFLLALGFKTSKRASSLQTNQNAVYLMHCSADWMFLSGSNLLWCPFLVAFLLKFVALAASPYMDAVFCIHHYLRWTHSLCPLVEWSILCAVFAWMSSVYRPTRQRWLCAADICNTCNCSRIDSLLRRLWGQVPHRWIQQEKGYPPSTKSVFTAFSFVSSSSQRNCKH